MSDLWACSGDSLLGLLVIAGPRWWIIRKWAWVDHPVDWIILEAKGQAGRSECRQADGQELLSEHDRLWVVWQRIRQQSEITDLHWTGKFVQFEGRRIKDQCTRQKDRHRLNQQGLLANQSQVENSIWKKVKKISHPGSREQGAQQKQGKEGLDEHFVKSII